MLKKMEKEKKLFSLLQVREAKPEMTRYAGELSGIRAGVKKSTRL